MSEFEHLYLMGQYNHYLSLGTAIINSMDKYGNGRSPCTLGESRPEENLTDAYN